MTDALTSFAPLPSPSPFYAYGINTQGGMNPCFAEAMETIMTCHYSGAIVFPNGDGAVTREAPPLRGNRNEA